MRTRLTVSALILMACALPACRAPSQTEHASAAAPGQVLPDRRPGEFPGTIAESVKASKAVFPVTRGAPANAPNVIVILLDDVGFGATSTFGGPIPTPALDTLARSGLRYNQWHTTALCSPTRAALLTGRNHHEVGFGVISEIATGFPGYDAVMPDSAATIGAILKENGYNTAWFGKNHNTPDYETSQAGPFIQWPTGMGFEYFFGFNGGDTNQWSPALVENTRPIEPPTTPGYHFMTDMTDRSIAWIRNQKSTAPNKPFFVYFAPGATHAPHHSPKAWADRFKGQFDQGWNKVSEDTFARMKQQGIIPADSKYNAIPEEAGSWEKLDPDRRKIYTRMMEVYAGYLAFTDFECGRLLESVNQLGIGDNTLVIYAVGDNGASAEGGFGGTLNEIAADFNGYRPDNTKDVLKRIDEIGGPYGYNHYPVGWALALSSPLKYAKRQASHFGGTRNGLVISWPARIKDAGGLRTQFHHVSDIAPTILEAAAIPQPQTVNGVAQTPMSGISMVYTFDAANKTTPSKRTTQYFEIGGNRAIYHDGWVAATTHGMNSWSDTHADNTFDKDTWELYDISKDFTEHDDVSAQFADRLNDLKAMFLAEARKYNVMPLDDRGPERFIAKLAGRPLGPSEGITKFTYYPGMTRLPEGSAPDVKNRSFVLAASVEIPKKGADGILITQGGLFAGWGLMLKNGKLRFTYNWLQEQITNIDATSALTAGEHVIRFEFTYDGGGVGKGGKGVLFVDDKSVGEGRIEKTVPNRFSLDEGLDVGEDTGTPLTRDYQVPFRFTGTLKRITVELK